MKLVKIFAGLALIIVILYFLLQNTSPVDVNLVFYEKEAVPVSVVMLGALAIGMIIGYSVALAIILSGKSEIRSLKNKNRHLSDELNGLRNAAIDDEIYSSNDEVD